MIEIKNKWTIGGIFVAVGGAFVGLAVWLSPGQPAEQSPQQIEQAGQVEPETSSTAPTAPSTTGTETSNSGDSGTVNGGNGEPAAPADRVQPPSDDTAEPAAEPDPVEPPVGAPPPNQVPTSTTEWHPYCQGPQDPTPGCIPYP